MTAFLCAFIWQGGFFGSLAVWRRQAIYLTTRLQPLSDCLMRLCLICGRCSCFKTTTKPILFLTVVEFMSFRRSGISALLGLWAELTIGLEGVGMFRDPMVLVLGLRTDSRSSLSPTPSLTPLGLRLGCVVVETPGPPDTRNKKWSQVSSFLS